MYIGQNQKSKYKLFLKDSLLGDEYSIYYYLGSGKYSDVFLATHTKNQKKYVIKYYQFDTWVPQQAEQIKAIIKHRISILKSIPEDCQHVLKCYDVFENFKSLAYVTDYCEVNLQSQINKKHIDRMGVIKIIKQILKGLEQLLKIGIVLRIVKPKSIFKKNGIYKIGSFEFENDLLINPLNSECNHFVDSKNSIWCPPSIQTSLETIHSKECSWAVGALYYYLLTQQETLIQLQKSSKIKLEDIKFIKCTLEKNKQNRFSWSQIKKQKIFNIYQQQVLSSFFQFDMVVANSIQSQVDEVTFQLGTLKKELRQINFDFQPKPFSIVSLSKSDIEIYTDRIDNLEEITYTLIEKEYAFVQFSNLLIRDVIKPIQEDRLLDLTSRKNIQFMYLLSSRSFKNLSDAKKKISQQKENFSGLVDHFLAQMPYLYEQTKRAFQKYQNKLTKKQNSVASRMWDFFNKEEQKSNILNGVEGIDYTYQQHTYNLKLNYIDSGIIKQIRRKSKKHENLVQILQNFSDLGIFIKNKKIEDFYSIVSKINKQNFVAQRRKPQKI